jgi:ketosteroid isomerase-like protein
MLALAALAAALLIGGAAEDEAALRALEAKWDTATLKGDAATLGSILADGFVSTDSDGTVRTKAEIVSELRAGNIRYASAKTDDVKVALYGDAAVVTGRWEGRYTFRGAAKHLRERYTNFYVRLNGRWRCVAAHGSAIR